MMRAQTEPRRVYNRHQVTHVTFAGTYFAPTRETKINTSRDVKIEALEPRGGKQLIEVSQRVSGKQVRETWRETRVPVKHRSN
jgi:hypothetical protein